MLLESKWCTFFKYPGIFSVLLFLIFIPTLNFSDASPLSNKSLDTTNDSSDLTNSSTEQSFVNTSGSPINTNNSFNQPNQSLKEQKIKIVAAGDFGCGPVAQSNIKEIEQQKPDIFLVIGDLSYEPSMDCWYAMTNALYSKIKIAIGNHEDEEEKAKGGSTELKNSLLKHYNLEKPYYSFNYKNVHFLILDTQLELSLNIFKPEEEERGEEKENNNNELPGTKYYSTTLKDLLDKRKIKAEIPPYHLINDEMIVEDVPLNTEQYQFVVNDLQKYNNNSSIDWIIVLFHKPFYSSLSSHIQEYLMREKYQPVFDKYGVDIVLQGHNHIYDRTLPLQFNPNNISNPIVDESNNTIINKFFNPKGEIFSVIGTGGDSNHIILNHPYYVAKQHNGFGFLGIEINGKELDAKYYDIGYKCKKEKLKEKDLEEGVFKIYAMSTCNKDNNKDSLEIVDHYTISKEK
jgi:3',5'-cyclic AMP phosphodiesterase CpdA